MSTVSVQKRPVPLSVGVGLMAAIGATVTTVGSGAVWVTAGVLTVGLGLLVAGAAGYERDLRAVGLGTWALGAGVVVLSIPLGAVLAGEISTALIVVSGLVGVVSLALGLVPVRGEGSRRLVKLGVSFLFLGVLVAALFRASPVSWLLVSAGLAVVAWDVGENAIGLGEQLGIRAQTTHIQLVHAAGTVAVATVGVVAARAVAGLTVGEVSLSSFVLLLVALLLLTVSLHE